MQWFASNNRNSIFVLNKSSKAFLLSLNETDIHILILMPAMLIKSWDGGMFSTVLHHLFF